jgi:hypothetical protein
MKIAIEAMVLHLFNDHSKCQKKTSAGDQEGWCKADIAPDHVPAMLQRHGGYIKDVAGFKSKMIEVLPTTHSPLYSLKSKTLGPTTSKRACTIR